MVHNALDTIAPIATLLIQAKQKDRELAQQQSQFEQGLAAKSVEAEAGRAFDASKWMTPSGNVRLQSQTSMRNADVAANAKLQAAGLRAANGESLTLDTVDDKSAPNGVFTFFKGNRGGLYDTQGNPLPPDVKAQIQSMPPHRPPLWETPSSEETKRVLTGEPPPETPISRYLKRNQGPAPQPTGQPPGELVGKMPDGRMVYKTPDGQYVDEAGNPF
jgi:hypothetical protein